MRIKEIFENLEVDIPFPVFFHKEGEAPAWVELHEKELELHLCENEFLRLLSISNCPAEKVMRIVLEHEMLHVLLDHFHNFFTKRGNFNHFLMNVAADAVINPMIDGFKDCFDVFDPEEPVWQGMPYCNEEITAEDLYSRIVSKVPNVVEVTFLDHHKPLKGSSVSEALARKIEKTLEELKSHDEGGRGHIHRLVGDIERFFEEEKIRRSWVERILLQVLQVTFKPSTKRPSRRHPDFPGTKLKSAGDFLVLIDASGSVSSEVLGKAARLCKLLARSGRIRVYSYDEKPYRITIKELEEGRLKGGGGTNLREVLKKLSPGGKDSVVVITDGLDEYPAELLPRDSFVVVFTEFDDENSFYQEAQKHLGKGRVFLEGI